MNINQQEKVFENIKNSAKVMIGSRAYGGFNKESDYDFVMTNSETETLIAFLKKKNINFTLNGGSSEIEDPEDDNDMFNTYNLKFMLNYKTVNILGYHEDEISNMLIVDDCMKKIMKTALSENIKAYKNYRIAMFQTILKNIFDNLNRPGIPEIDIDEDEIPF